MIDVKCVCHVTTASVTRRVIYLLRHDVPAGANVINANSAHLGYTVVHSF